MIEYEIELPPGEPFDPAHTFRSGQVFRWRLVDGWWYGPYGAGSLSIQQTGGALKVRALGVEPSAEELHRFLGLQRRLADFYERFSNDPPLAAAFAAAPGLRILRQQPWECTAAFICSSWNNIPKIELSLERISRSAGRLIRWPEGVEIAAFPSAAELAATQSRWIPGCGLGYRIRYLAAAAEQCAAAPELFAEIDGLPYGEALRRISALPGAGRKVADCILLFAFDQPAAFPVDVWVRRALRDFYPEELREILGDEKSPLSAAEQRALIDFAARRWGDWSGYAQQYLFHTRRSTGRGGFGQPVRDK